MESARVRNAYSVPDVAMFGSTGKFNSARSLPSGERVSLPYFGKAPVRGRCAQLWRRPLRATPASADSA